MMEKENYSYFQIFDYYSENEKDFWSKFSDGEYTKLVQGKHRTDSPLVSILLTTYKRVNYLELALESALNQVGFEDYQVIVVDNEAAPIDVQTDTSIFMKRYEKNEKVVYYRNIKPARFKMDTAVSIAQSEWICFLHDDDMLNKNHLRVMMNMVRRYPQVKYLTATIKCINEQYGKKDEENEGYNMEYFMYQWPKSLSGKGIGWLGALINKKCYISTGGMPTNETGIGDFMMTGKFHYRYGVYILQGNPLYLYRVWSRQTTALENWVKLYTIEYNYCLYDLKKRHVKFENFWSRFCAYDVIGKYKRMQQSVGNTSSENMDNLIADCSMSGKVNVTGVRYTMEYFIGRSINYLKRIWSVILTKSSVEEE